MRSRLLIAIATTALFLLVVASANAAAPVVLKEAASQITSESAILKAEVNPEERATFYRFEYGLADCSLNPCTQSPVGELPKGGAPVPVEAKLSGLTPATTYHFRVIADNPDGKDEGTDRTFTTFALPPVFGSCPNDFLRLENPMAEFIEHSSANLPDCRAYEQASPVDKNGVDAKGMAIWVKAAADGTAVSFLTTSGIPGGEGAQELPPSLARKGAEGWTTEGMLPPANLGEEAFVLGWTRDFSHVFSSAKLLDEPQETAFLSRAVDGSFEEIVPHAANVRSLKFAGSTDDGSVVLFESNGELLDGAIEGASNVYVWDRSSGELRLAGIFNEGEAPPQGAFAGSYDWTEGEEATDKGGAAEFYYLQDQNALAGDGSAVYFTAAGSGQLYLRLNPTEPQSPLDKGKCTNPALACTVNVSASQKTNGIGPGGTDAAGKRPAAFLGASDDGSVAFFTSSEKLTNDANTGTEPEPPAIARANIDGTGTNLNFLPTKATGVTLDANFVYWANPEDDVIGRAKLDGTDEDPDFISGLENPQYVAVDATHIYWSQTGELDSEGKPQDGEGTIGRAKLDGSEPNQSFITGASNPQGVAVNATHVFWGNAGLDFTKLDTRTIGRAKLDGGEINQVFIQVDQGSQKFMPQGIALNATHIYVAIDGTQDQSYVFRYDLDGTNRSLVFDDQHKELPGVRGVALDANFVYWAREGRNTIGRAKLDLTSPEREFIKGAANPFGLAVNATHVFWAANQGSPPNPGNDLYRYEVDSGELTDLSVDSADLEKGADVQGILGTSEDGSRVYFVASGVLAPGAAPGDCKGQIDVFINFTGECSLYLSEEGEATRFIARLDANGTSSDAVDWLPHGASAGVLEKAARVAPDGATLLFRSQRQLTPYDNEGVPQFYRYQVGDAGPTCVSCNPTGVSPVGGPTLGSIGLSFLIPSIEPSMVLSRNLSADGNRVFFESLDPLVGSDTNGEKGCPEKGTANFAFPICRDVYEWEAQGTGSCKEDVQGGGCLYLLSSGKSPEASFFADASESGDDAFLITSTRLVGQDQDQLYDVYDASVDGGLKAQNEPPAPICVDEACKNPSKPTPAFQSPNTTAPGSGNVKPKAKPGCPKGKRKVRAKNGKTRCVPKRKKGQGGKGKGRKRVAKTNGRVGR